MSTASTERGAWTCTACGFRGFWSGGPHDCAADDPRDPLDVIARALRLLEEAATRRDVGELTARDLENNARQLLRVALGVAVDAKPIDTRQLKQTLEAATRCLQRNDWGTAFDRVQDALALLPDGVSVPGDQTISPADAHGSKP